MRTVQYFVTFERQMGFLSGERSSRTRNPKINKSQIDHVAINKTWRSSLQETRVMRSADAGSDHHLVVAVIKMKLLALKKQSSSRKKYCTHRFKDQTVR